MPIEPAAALGFYTTDVDILITLGFALAKKQPIRDNYDTFPSYFPVEPLAGIEPFANYPEFRYEAVLEAAPDFILNGLAYDEDTIERLPQIAATYSVNGFDGQDWRVHFQNTAEALGRQEQHQAWVDEYQALLERTKQDIAASAAADWTVIDIGYWNDAVQLGRSGVPYYSLVDDLQLKTHPLMGAETPTPLPAERLGELADADVAIMGRPAGPSGDAALKETLNTLDGFPTWRDLPFVKNDRIYGYDMEMTFGSPNGQSAFVEWIRTTLLEAT